MKLFEICPSLSLTRNRKMLEIVSSSMSKNEAVNRGQQQTRCVVGKAKDL